MRRCYDSTNAADIPPSAEIVAGYIDGRFRWLADDWARFPDAVKVRIAAFASTNDGHVLDVEQGDATPDEVPGWLTARRAAGADPTVYVNRANWQAVRDACALAEVAEPHYWLAAYDGVAEVPAGTVAKQYANEAITGAHYDLSAVADVWPGVDKEEVVDHPVYQGETVAVVIVDPSSSDPEKRVARCQATWRYPDGSFHSKERKGELSAGMKPYVIYPDVAPGSDETEDLDAQPGVFIVVAQTV